MAEEKYSEAFVPLLSILDSERFKPYEKAVAAQTMGFIYAAKSVIRKPSPPLNAPLRRVTYRRAWSMI